MIDLEVEGDDDILHSLEEYAKVTKKELSAVIEKQSKQFVKSMVEVTPPAGGGVKRGEAKKRLEGRIMSDMLGILTPVKGRAPKGGWPDAEAIFRNQRMKRVGNRFHRSPRVRVNVKNADFNRLYRKQKLKVGRLMGGWNAAASKLGVKRPAWIARHGLKEGGIRLRLRGNSPRVLIWNAVPYASDIHLQKIADYAVIRGMRSLDKQIEHIRAKALKKSKLSA